MAKVFPSEWRNMASLAEIDNEIVTLNYLETALDDSYTIYHGVHWTRVESRNFAIYGEIDFAIVGPSGKLLLIEQKNGSLQETSEGLIKHYPDGPKNVNFQMARNVDNLSNRLKRFANCSKIFVDSLLYCPDYRINKIGAAGIPPERIVDTRNKDQLADIIKKILPSDAESNVTLALTHRFLSDTLELVPEVNAILGQAKSLYTRVSGGLSTWAQRIEFEPFRLRVIGTAGSGKTQLALAVYQKVVEQGGRPLYVCYNRSLADHIARIVPVGGEVAGYHQFCDRVASMSGQAIDHTKPEPFAAMERVLDGYAPEAHQMFDALIVDEGQDFKASWAANLLRWLKPQGKAWWMEDPMQNIYSRESLPLENWVTIRSNENFRSPQNILDDLNSLIRPNPPIRSGSPIKGHEVTVITYSDEKDLVRKTIQGLDLALNCGFKSNHVALLTFRGREGSALSPYSNLGRHSLRTPVLGQYDSEGNPVINTGEFTTDSVHRFKGQSAPCVVLSEIDFTDFDENVKRRIFVGATRATMKLILVISDRAAKLLSDRAGD